MAKGTPIHVHLLDHPDVKRFVEAAEKACDVFERIDELSKIEFLQQLEELLPLAYSLLIGSLTRSTGKRMMMTQTVRARPRGDVARRAHDPLERLARPQ